MHGLVPRSLLNEVHCIKTASLAARHQNAKRRTPTQDYILPTVCTALVSPILGGVWGLPSPSPCCRSLWSSSGPPCKPQLLLKLLRCHFLCATEYVALRKPIAAQLM